MGVVDFISVDEYQVEGSKPFGFDDRQARKSAADAYVDAMRESGASNVRTSDLRVPSLGLERDQPAAFRQGTRQPDRAVSAQRPYLENIACLAQPREQMEKLSLQRRDILLWQ